MCHAMLDSRITVIPKTDTVTVLKECTAREQSDIDCDECSKRTKVLRESKTCKWNVGSWAEVGVREGLHERSVSFL